jgi:signal transduction histidine kinase/Tfp pilus assembly protein PilF
MTIRNLLLSVVLTVTSGGVCTASEDYKQSQEYLSLRDSMHHAFNHGDSARFFVAVKNLEDYLLKQDDFHAYYTQRCNEIIFLMNQQKIFEAYKLATQLSKELRERKLDDEMYMAINMMGHIYRYCGKKESAKQCFREVLERMEEAGYYESMPPIYMNIVNVEMGDNPEEATRLLTRALEIARESSPERVFDIETRRTLSYYNQGKLDEFEEGYKLYKEGVAAGKSSVHGRSLEVYHEASLGHTDKAIEIALKTYGDESKDIIVNICEKAGRWEEAYKALKEAMTAKDSINSLILSNSMEGIQDELKLYEAEREGVRMRTITMSIIIALLVMLIIALTYIVNSRRRHLHELKKAYEHALESDKIKTAFIQNVSHEVRTPLNIISGFAQVFSTPEMDAGPEERQHIAQMVLTNTQLITSLVDEMLELSVSEASDRPKLTDVIEINDLMRDLLQENQGRITPDTKMRYESTLADDFTMTTNETMLKRIVGTLIDNAAKNTTEGSITLKAAADEDVLTITVEDTGCGIPPEEAERIFERFVKLNSFKEGVGLGLTLSRTLANRLGGNVTLDTNYVGPGARFVVTLPLKEETE